MAFFINPFNSIIPEHTITMKLLKIISLQLFLYSQFGVAQETAYTEQEQEVLKAQSDRISAMIIADVETLNLLLAEDLSYAHTTGWTETKSGYLETVKSGKIDYQKFVPGDIKVRFYGETAVLTGKVDVNLGRTDFTIRFLEVQRKVNGIWKLDAWQSVLSKVD